MKPCLLFLTCKDQEETEKISDVLLQKKLVSCIKKIPINSSYIWKNKIEKSNEVLLIINSSIENYELVDKEVKKIHSYETYTLFCVKIEKLNKQALKWLSDNLLHSNITV